jgi:hypothetical protein
MKLLVASLASLFLSATGLRADLVIVQKVDGSGQSGEQTIKIKGDKARTDLAQAMSMITDGATGESITLMHQPKTYLKLSPDRTKAMMDQLQALRTSTEPAKLQPTGKKEKVGEYECEIFTANLGALTATYWIAKDFPNYPAVLAQLEKLQAGSISAMGKGLMPELKDFPGMMMKTEIDLGGKKIVTTVLSAKEENVDPAIFKIPANYKEVSSPALNFQPAK